MARTTTDKIQLELTIGGKQAGATLKDLNGAARTLNKELNNLTPGTEEFRKKAEQLRSVNARINEIKTEIKGVSTEMAKAGSGFKQFAGGVGDGLTSLIPLGAAAAGAFAVGKVLEFGRGAVEAFNEAENASADMYQALVVNLGFTEDAFQRLASQADELELKTFGFTAEEIQGAQKQLGIFGLTADEIEKLTPKLLDLARSQKIDLAAATDIATQAMLGKTKALEAMGIHLTETQKTVQGVTNSLEKFAGTSEAALQVGTNRFEVLKDKWGKWEESVGKSLLIAGTRIASFLGIVKDSDITPIIEKQSEAILQEKNDLNEMAHAVMNANTNQEARKELLNELNAKYPGFLGNLSAESASNAQIAERLGEVNDQYERKIRLEAASENLKETLKKEQDLKKQILLGDIQLAKAQAKAEAERLAQTEYVTQEEIAFKKNSLDFQKSLTEATKNTREEELKQIADEISASKQLLAEAQKNAKEVEKWIGKSGAANPKNRKIQTGKDLDANAKNNGDEARKSAEKTAKDKEDADKKAAEADKKALEDRQKARDAYNKRVLEGAKLLLSQEILLMEEGLSKELAIIEQKKREELEKISGLELELAQNTAISEQERTQLQETYTKARQNITEKAAAETLAAQKEFSAKEVKLANDKNQEILAEEEKQTEHLRKVKLAQLDLDIIAAAGNDEKLLQAKIARLEAEREIELDNVALTETEAALIKAKYENEIAELKKNNAETQKALDKEVSQAAIALLQEGLSALSQFSSIKADKEIGDADKVKAARIRKLDEEKRKGKISEEKYAKAKEAIEAESQKRVAAIKREQALKEKQLSIVQSVINTAVAITAALTKDPTGILATIVGISGAIQTALIASKPIPEFRDGGKFENTPTRRYNSAGIAQGARHSHGGIKMVDAATGKIVGEMEGGEPHMILSRNTYANNKGVIDSLLYNSIYRNGAKIFANGGLIGTSPITSLPPSAASGQPQDLSRVEALLAILIQEVQAQKTKLEAYITYSTLDDAISEIDRVKRKANR